MAKSENSFVVAARRLDVLVNAMQTSGPNAEDVAAVEQLLKDTPGLWKEVSLAHIAAIVAIETESDRDDVRVAMKANYYGVRRELGVKDASPMERLLIDHVALCWFRLQTLEQRYSRMMSKSISLSQGQYWERRLNAAQQRYLRACETLARVRKLIRRTPVLQVNIAAKGGQQVNVA